MEIKNAKIKSTQLGFDWGVFLTFWLYLQYYSCGQRAGSQGAGGFVLHNTTHDDAMPISVISDLLNCIGVERWEDLPGKYVRVKASFAKVHAIGNISKDKWFVINDLKRYIKQEEKEEESH